jgi:hypothetical protein
MRGFMSVSTRHRMIAVRLRQRSHEPLEEIALPLIQGGVGKDRLERHGTAAAATPERPDASPRANSRAPFMVI